MPSGVKQAAGDKRQFLAPNMKEVGMINHSYKNLVKCKKFYNLFYENLLSFSNFSTMVSKKSYKIQETCVLV